MSNIIIGILAEPGGFGLGEGSDAMPWMLVLGIVVLAFFMLVRTRRKVRESQAKSGLSVDERVARHSHREGTIVADHINELMAELADLSRQINGQLDTRLARLDILLQEADERISQLERSGSRNGSGRARLAEPVTSEAVLAEPMESDVPLAEAGHSDRVESVESESSLDASGPGTVKSTQDENDVAAGSNGLSNGSSKDDAANGDVQKDGKARPGKDSAGVQSEEPRRLSESPANREVIELASAGVSPTKIAQQLSRPLGEIKLILALSKQKEQG